MIIEGGMMTISILQRRGVLLATMLTLASASTAQGQALMQLSDEDQYVRCHTRLARQFPAANDALLKDIRDKKRTGAQACLALVDRAALKKTNGKIASTSDTVAIAVLRTLHTLHRSWFQSREPIATNDGAKKQSVSVVQDIEEPALYYTRAALMEDMRFDSIVKGNDSLRGIRIRPNSAQVNNFMAQVNLRHPSYVDWKDAQHMVVAYHDVSDGNKRKSFNMADNEITTVGQMIGIEVPKPFVVPWVLRPGIPSSGSRADLVRQIDLDRKNYNVRRHLGGGILGSQQFIMANANLVMNQMQVGEEMINRRLTARIFQDLMCHELPTLTDADVKGDVDPKSHYSFRQTSSCMRCHSSVDEMAMAYRNKVIVRTSARPDVDTNLIGWGLPTILAITPKAGSTDLNHQPPTTRVRFRELITGKAVSTAATDLAGVGNVLAANQDLYLCAAQRYYQFFTGVKVALVKLDSKSSTYQLDKEHQDFVVKLAQDLKSKQKVRDLFYAIFQSKAFKARNYNSVVAQEGK